MIPTGRATESHHNMNDSESGGHIPDISNRNLSTRINHISERQMIRLAQNKAKQGIKSFDMEKLTGRTTAI